MGVTKTSLYDPALNEMAKIAKVLGHPARVSILQYISRVDGCICGNIVDEVGLAQATISQHLKELKSIGLIKGTVEGNSICYCIDYKAWKGVKSKFNQFFENVLAGESCC